MSTTTPNPHPTREDVLMTFLGIMTQMPRETPLTEHERRMYTPMVTTHVDGLLYAAEQIPAVVLHALATLARYITNQPRRADQERTDA